MKYMLDTNICIYAQKGISAVIERMRDETHNGLAISAITLAELRHGIEGSNAYDKNVQRLNGLLNIVDVIPFDGRAAAHYGQIAAYLRKNGMPIGTMDMLIAAHARSLGLTVVTNNIREFERVPDLKIENWLK